MHVPSQHALVSHALVSNALVSYTLVSHALVSHALVSHARLDSGTHASAALHELRVYEGAAHHLVLRVYGHGGLQEGFI